VGPGVTPGAGPERFRGNGTYRADGRRAILLWHFARRPKNTVIPAKAGIHFATVKDQWIPAFAGMTADFLRGNDG